MYIPRLPIQLEYTRRSDSLKSQDNQRGPLLSYRHSDHVYIVASAPFFRWEYMARWRDRSLVVLVIIRLMMVSGKNKTDLE
jgi:hypothetical protein